MRDDSARGVYIISVTPFDERGALDLDGTDRLIDFYLKCGVDGITILGVMGEAPKLGHDEAVAFARRVIARACKLPVVTVGGLGGTLQTGRVLDYIGKGDQERKLCGLHLALMKRMGVKAERFGDATEALAGL